MIAARAPLAPMCSSVSCCTVLTVAAVPTGMKTGVWTTPCGRCNAARRPPVDAVELISNFKPIVPVCLAAGFGGLLLCHGDGLRDREVVGDADEVAVFGVLVASDGLEEDRLAVDGRVERYGLP